MKLHDLYSRYIRYRLQKKIVKRIKELNSVLDRWGSDALDGIKLPINEAIARAEDIKKLIQDTQKELSKRR